MVLHLNYDGKQNNGVIFNADYKQGCMYEGVEFRPTLSFDYESFMYSEVFTGQPNYVIQPDGIKRLMTSEEEAEVVAMATSWVQPLGQEGNPTQKQQLEIDKAKLKRTGELYADTGITVPFTNEVANGLMQIKNGFDAAAELVSTGSMQQADYDALSVNLEISKDVKLPLTPATILPFSAWFWTKRSSLF